MLELYDNHISVCCQAVRLAFAEKGLDWVMHHIRFQTADRYAPDYLKLNPRGQVPTLVHDGQTIVESTVILEYLEDCYPTPPLRPDRPVERARMRMWSKRVDESIHAACGHITFATAWRPVYLAKSPEEVAADVGQMKDPVKQAQRVQCLEKGLDADEVVRAIHIFDRMLADMETVLEGHDWLTGNQLSIADLKIVPYVIRLDHLDLEWMWQGRPQVADWYRRLQARPSFKVAITDLIPQREIDVLRTGGRDRAKIEEILASSAGQVAPMALF